MRNRLRVLSTCFAILLLSLLWINQRDQALGQGQLPQLGISYAQYNAGAYASALSDQTVEELADAGAEWINIVVTQYQYDLNTTEIYPTGKTPTNDDLIHIIAKAKSLGLKVSLKPHIDIQSNPSEWRGRIGRDFNETQWSDWFASYRNFMGGYADFAAAQNVDQLIVGTELVSTVQRETQWREVIALVRGKYSGTLTYSANHSGEEVSINWWDALDIIGVSGYYDLTDETDPTIDELKAAWQPHRDTMLGLYEQWNKPILFTEVGYRSSDGNNRHPWCYWCDEPIDLQEQADGYQAYFEVFFNEPWFAGLHIWGWRIEPERSGPCNDGYSPYNKPAENVLRQYYGASQRSISTICDPNQPTPIPTPTSTIPPPVTPVADYALINFTADTPVIDGSAESIWQSANGNQIKNVLLGTEVPAFDLKANFRALYDADYLYIFVDVQDDQLHQDSGDQVWQDDVIEVFIDGNQSAGTVYDGVDDYQLLFRWNDPQIHVGTNTGTAPVPDNIRFAMIATGNGYVAEIALPLAGINITPANGNEFGLDVQVIDDDDGGDRETKYAWHGTTDDSWQNPSLFGTGRLFGDGAPSQTPTPTMTPAPLTPTATAAPPETPVIPSGLTQEAEAGLLSGLFVSASDGSASAGAYVHVPDGSGNRGSALDPAQKASYTFNVTDAGIYRIKAWVRSPNGSNNSFYVQVDGAPAAGYLYHTPISSAFLEQYVTNGNGNSIVEVNLSAGTHTIDFFLREHGTALDKVALERIGGGPPPPTATQPPPPTATAIPAATPTATPVVVTGCDGLAREAETGTLSGLFVTASGSGASGGSYVHVPNGSGNRGSTLDPAQKASYCFTVTNAGLYRIQTAVHSPNGNHNSFYVQVNGAPAAGYLYHAPISNSFINQYVTSGNSNNTVEVNLAAGTHTVDFLLREQDTRLDKVTLERVGD